MTNKHKKPSSSRYTNEQSHANRKIRTRIRIYYSAQSFKVKKEPSNQWFELDPVDKPFFAEALDSYGLFEAILEYDQETLPLLKFVRKLD